jgi:hypothetical protein
MRGSLPIKVRIPGCEDAEKMRAILGEPEGGPNLKVVAS